MSLASLLRHNLWFHRRAHVVVLLGLAVGAAVLSGSLLLGDSLRWSLRQLTLARLGRIDVALAGDQFFPASLADRLASASGHHLASVVPAILVRGSALIRRSDGSRHGRAGQVQVVGVDERFWSLFGLSPVEFAGAVVLNEPLAAELGANPGDLVEIRFDRPQRLPADSVIGKRNQAEGLLLEQSPIHAIVPLDASGPWSVGRFSLAAQQARPRLVFVELRRLQNRLARDGDQLPGSANALLIACASPLETSDDLAPLKAALRKATTLEDLGLVLRRDESKQRYLSLETQRMILPPEIERRVLKMAGERGWRAVPTLTYLANLITRGEAFPADIAAAIGILLGRPGPVPAAWLARAAVSYTPYSAVTGLDPSARSPFGPLLLANGQPGPTLKDDEVLLTEPIANDLWPLGDWKRDLGKPCVRLSYFVEGGDHLLEERNITLKLAGVVPIAGAAADPALTPEFPGLRGARIADWRPPFPRSQWHPEWIRESDEAFYRRHRVTPKAYVSPELAEKLWSSRHGSATSIRLALGAGSLAEQESEVRSALETAITPEAAGLTLQPVKLQGLAATASGTARMFGWLFVGFSSFILLASSLLVGLLFRLGLERRAREWGLLFALGLGRRTVTRLALAEGALVAMAGAALGALAGLGYAALLIVLLRSTWQTSLDTTFLRFHVSAENPAFGPLPYPSLLLGFLSSVLIATVTIRLSIRGFAGLAPIDLLSGRTQPPDSQPLRADWTKRTAVVATTLAMMLAGLSFVLPRHQTPGLFFGSGFLLLVAGLSAARLLLNRRAGWRSLGAGWTAFSRLGISYAGRNPGRSLLTVGLLAAGTFLVIAVQAFRQAPYADDAKVSGTGGFRWVANAEVTLPYVPKTPAAWSALAEAVEVAQSEATPFPAGATIYGLRLRGGDDVSCLNLYQPGQPRIVGVPPSLIERGGFRFRLPADATAAEKANPWTLLNRSSAAAIPILADDHAAEWVLRKAIGDAWEIEDEQGQKVAVCLVGMLVGSLFQSELLMSETNFHRIYPGAGYRLLLIEADQSRADAARMALDQAFGDAFGLTIASAANRLAEFQAVENTYLATFQALGGIGLLLGAVGLGVVMMRNLNERRGEWALFRALGYSERNLAVLAAAENGLLILLGMLIGVGAAALAIAPNLARQPQQIPWLSLLLLLFLIALCGTVAGALALRSSLRTPLLAALGRE
jgi:putative ABC transport system permease protein